MISSSHVINTTESLRRKAENATGAVGNDVLESFRDSANKEKLRVEQTHRDKKAQDKAVSLNDLMSFSKNFKLHMPIPVDLIPILTKGSPNKRRLLRRLIESIGSMKEVAANPSDRGKLINLLQDQKVLVPDILT